MFKEPEPIYNLAPFTIYDEDEYFAVFKDWKQIAAFKEKKLAFDFVKFYRDIVEE